MAKSANGNDRAANNNNNKQRIQYARAYAVQIQRKYVARKIWSQFFLCVSGNSASACNLITFVFPKQMRIQPQNITKNGFSFSFFPIRMPRKKKK